MHQAHRFEDVLEGVRALAEPFSFPPMVAVRLVRAHPGNVEKNTGREESTPHAEGKWQHQRQRYRLLTYIIHHTRSDTARHPKGRSGQPDSHGPW